MALLLPINAVVDIYRGFHAGHPYPGSGAQPAQQGVRGHLQHDAGRGRLGPGPYLRWTTLLYLPLGTDLRSAYNTQLNSWQATNADTVVVKDYPIRGWCTAFLVVLVQRINRQHTGDCLCAYLDRLRPRSGPCFQGPCPNPLPATLHATVPVGSGCFCLDGTVVTLTYSAATDSWSGSGIVCADENFSLTFQAGTLSCADATLTVSFDNHGTVGPVVVDPGCSCVPVNFVFRNITFPELGSECDGPISVVITS